MKKFYIFTFLALIAVCVVGFVLTAEPSGPSKGPSSSAKKTAPGKPASSENFKF